MHLSESESGCGTSLSELANKCEVEEEVVRNCMTYWIARGVVSESRDRRREIDVENIISGATSSSSSSGSGSGSGSGNGSGSGSSSSSGNKQSDYNPNNDESGSYYHIIEEQAANALKDLEESSSGNIPGGIGGEDPSEVRSASILFIKLNNIELFST